MSGPDPLHDLVSLVMDNPPTLAFILDLLPSESREVERWAALEHLAASDNGNERVPMPKCLRRCPHDGGRCHHNCNRFPGTEECYREEGGMSLTEPWEGYPLRGHGGDPELLRDVLVRTDAVGAMDAAISGGRYTVIEDDD